MHTTEANVRDELALAPRDATQSRHAVILIDEGDTAWDGAQGKIGRARNGGSIVAVLYVETPDGAIHTKPIQTPVVRGK